MGVNQYSWLFTVAPYFDAGPVHTLRISDDAVVVDGVGQFEPGVIQWGRVILGAMDHVDNGYFRANFQVQVQVRSYSDQEAYQTILDLVRRYYWLEADVTLEYIDYGAPAPTPVTVFQGTVTGIGGDRETLTIDVSTADSADHQPGLLITRGRYEDSREEDRQLIAPLIIGVASWDEKLLLRDMTGSSYDDVINSNLWKYLVTTRGHAPVRIVDTRDATGYQGRVSSTTSGYIPTDVERRGESAAILWPDDPRSPLAIINASYSADQLVIPKESAVNYPGSSYPAGPADRPAGGTYDGQIRVRRYHVPGEVTEETEQAWGFFWNAMGRSDLNTYAECNDPPANEWYRSQGRFLRYPGRPYQCVVSTDGATNAVMALVYGDDGFGNNLAWQLAINISTRPLDTQTFDLTTQRAGWALIGFVLSDVILNDFRTDDDYLFFNSGAPPSGRTWYGENYNPIELQYEHVGVRVIGTPGGNAVARVASLGLSIEHLVDPGPIMSLSKSGYLQRGLSSQGGDTGRPASVIARLDAQGAGVETPGASIEQFLIDATVNAKHPIQPGDINTGAGLGSFPDLDARLGTLITSATGGREGKWRISGVDERDVELNELLTVCSQSVFADFWYSPRLGTFNAQIFEAGQTTHGATLYFDDLNEGTIALERTSLDRVFTAIYLQCWGGSRTVYIDNSTTYLSANWQGNRDLGREAQADDAQDYYGRRVYRRSLDYVYDIAAAWEVCIRMWDLFRRERPVVRFDVDPAWGLAREPSEVFTTDASLDRVMPAPVRRAPSWAGLTWQINTIQIEPRGACAITATWNDPFYGGE